MQVDTSTREKKDVSIQSVLEWVNEIAKSWQLLPEGNNGCPQQLPVHLWFRGNKTSGYQLEPAIFRVEKQNQAGEDNVSTDPPYKNISPQYIANNSLKNCRIYEEGGLFAHLARRMPSLLTPSSTTLDTLSLFRHYKVPCRLLDWSDNVLIALYFASDCDFASNCEKEKDGEIFALNARELAKSVQFPHHKKDEAPVFGPDDLHTVLRTGMSLTSYLDELLSRQDVRNAAIGAGFSHDFWNCLLELSSFLKEEDIKKIEEINDESNILKEFSCLSGKNSTYKLLYDRMPILMRKRLEHYFQDSNSASKVIKKVNKKYKLAKLWLFKFLFDLRKPVAVFPERRNIRIVAQSGSFTIGGGDFLPKKLKREGVECRIPRPLHLDRNYPGLVQSITIPGAAKKKIRTELDMIGFHSANIYPDLTNQGEYIKDLWFVKIDD